MSLSGPDDITTVLKNRGIKSASNSERQLRFIGANDARTFRQIASALAAQFGPTDTDVATLGEFYETAVYNTGTTEQKSYEDIYDGVDWTVPAQDPTVKRALEEIYGDVDAEPTLSDRQKILTIFNATLAKRNDSSLREHSAGVARSQNNRVVQHDEDTRGIRGVEDFDAPIDPIA